MQYKNVSTFLQKLLAIWEIFKTRPRHHTIRRLKWINFNGNLRLNEASFMYKKPYVSAESNVKKTNFGLRNKVSQRITRNGSDVHIDYRITAVGQKAVSVSCAKLWNSMPMNIMEKFKYHRYVQTSMYQHLLENQ